MPYTRVVDIRMYYQNKEFDFSSYLTNREVEIFISEADAKIDSVIRKIYQLPLTDTVDLLIMQQISEGIVVDKIDGIIREKDSEGRFTRQRNTLDVAKDLLKRIETRKLILKATEKESVAKFNSIDSNGEFVEPRFKVANTDPRKWGISGA